jgi:hypothetical protein
MATRAQTRVPLYGNAALFVWTGLLNGDDGAPVELMDFADCSIQFTGTFGAGGTISWQGSNDNSATPTNWFILNDVQATAITKTAAGLEQVAELCRYVRPVVTAGDGTTSLVATLYARRGRA